MTHWRSGDVARWLTRALVTAGCLSVLAVSVHAQETRPPQGPQQPPNQNPPQNPPPSPPPPTIPPAPTSGFGAPLPGLTAAELSKFNTGRTGFATPEGPADGLGLVFNANNCAACHRAQGIGGGDPNIFATRFGTITGGKFDPLIRLGGPVLQVRGITTPDNTVIPPERVPAEATIVARRRTTPCFGFGLIDAVPDSVYFALAAKQATMTPATAGRVNKVTDLITGITVAGKFGWKAASPNLVNFSGDAYKEEMGITSKGWKRDKDGRSIEEENPPQGNAALLAHNPVASPNEPDLVDVIAFADFMRFLAPPPRGPINDTVKAGEKVFSNIGCANCHTPSLTTGTNASAALSLKTFAPYSDFLIHDMGSLGDGIEQGVARGNDMRTAPLWGLRTQTNLLHDGRAKSIEEAIQMHRGQGQSSADKFRNLSATDKAALMAFLKSL